MRMRGRHRRDNSDADALITAADEKLQQARAQRALTESARPRVDEVARTSEALARRNSIASLIRDGLIEQPRA